VLLAADGIPNRQIAPMVARNEHTVAQWRRRFETERLAGLTDRKRPGAPWSTTTTNGCGWSPP
jgi:transposase